MKIKLTQKEALNLASDALREKFSPDFVTVEMEEIPVPYVPLVVPMPNLAVIRRFAEVDPISGYRNKIQLIKEIRTAFGWGLKESKDFVEAFYP